MVHMADGANIDVRLGARVDIILSRETRRGSEAASCIRVVQYPVIVGSASSRSPILTLNREKLTAAA